MIEQLINSFTMISVQLHNNLPIVGVILLIPWTCFFISTVITQRILLLGIIPRTARGIPGIFFAPLLHANFNHLFFNSIPLAVLSAFLLINGLYSYIVITVLITVLSGFAIWCLARPGLYIGASALITGYWGFLISNAYQEASATTIILAALSLYYFAGIFLGIFPQQKGVSWEGHLCGLLAGLAINTLLSMH